MIIITSSLSVVAILLSLVAIYKVIKIQKTVPKLDKNKRGETILLDENNNIIYIN